GNFSIGDYFKAEVIPWAWSFLTDVLGIPTDRLMVSVHENDPEAYDIWLRKVGLPEHKIVKLGDEDNFWFMADTGPCGPDSEIFYDLGPEFGSQNGEYDGPGSSYGRWIEIWNLVFTQFDRQPDGTLEELPKKNVDTGSGLERTCVVLQDKKTVFQTDGFVPLIEYFEGKTRAQVGESRVNPYYVLADHLRATSFLIADGVYPDRAGRGYVLRRIMRRALRWANRLGFQPGEWFGAFPILKGLMGTQYPEIVEREAFIAERVGAEEELFLRTLSRGETLLQKNLEDLRAEHGGQLPAVFPGQLAFVLQDTYGFPLDITKDILEEHGLGVDEVAFNAALQEQRARSKADTLAKLGAALTTAEGGNVLAAFDNLPSTLFTSYSGSLREESTILGALEHEG
ncbi:MAG TPA: alanine--tRNA ligase-related protein, partial [bacterium]|nr:alanine--tRNA ligase-related protein [bacterium]